MAPADPQNAPASGQNSVPFSPWEIAAVEERRQAVISAELSDEHREWAGGIAAFGGLSSWLNQAVNAAMSGPVERGEVEAIARWFADRQVEPMITLTTYSHPSLRDQLAAAGFVVRSIETLMVTDLSGLDRPPTSPPPGTRLEVIDPSDDRAVEAYAAFAARIHFDGQENEILTDSFRRAVRHPRSVSMLLREERTDMVIAACGCEHFEHIGALWGGAVAPDHRRRGIQRMLIEQRLHLLRERGQRWATIASQPTIGTERNALRAGMRPAYTRLEMVRPGEGLVPSP